MKEPNSGTFKDAPGCITHIQRYSVHDGDGIRTTVFMKGCPLSCTWCSNPETQEPLPELFLDIKKCVLCGQCVKACPKKSLEIRDSTLQYDLLKCCQCFACIQKCPQNALVIKGEFYTPGKLAALLLKDSAFYFRSNGGVTFSGGEPLLQIDFIASVCKILKKSGLSCCIETSGSCAEDSFLKALECMDTVIFDIKHIDDEVHKNRTGQSTFRIFGNARLLFSSGKDFIFRIPLIPGFNATGDVIRPIVDFIKNCLHDNPGSGFRYVELIPYHGLGEAKYASLWREYKHKGLRAMDKKDKVVVGFYRFFEDRGIKIKG